MNTTEQLLTLEQIASTASPTREEVITAFDLAKDINLARFFFLRVTAESWAQAIVSDFEANPHAGEALWLRVRCILKVSAGRPELLLHCLDAISAPFDQRMLRDVVSASLKFDPDTAWKFRNYVRRYLCGRQFTLGGEVGKYFGLVIKSETAQLTEILELLGLAISFDRSKERDDPAPRFATWDYQQIINVGVTSVTDAAPLATAKLLADAVEQLIELKFEGKNRPKSEDASEIWCTNVSGFAGEHTDPEIALVHALTAAIEKTWKRNFADEREQCDAYLREKSPKVFTRIRHHVYATDVEHALPQIRRDVLSFAGYGEDRYDYEFARLISIAAEMPEGKFLQQREIQGIIAEIKHGPDRELYRKFHEETYTDERFERYQRHFHFGQLLPFESLLQGHDRVYFYDVAKTEGKGKSIENYRPHTHLGARVVEQRSPESAEALTKMLDDELIAFLNDWEPKGRQGDEWWVDISTHGLATAFRGAIKMAPDRFHSWKMQWTQIVKPAYLAAAIEAGQEEIKGANLTALQAWLDLSRHIISRPLPPVDTVGAEGHEAGGWDRMRRAVVDFLETCVEQKSPVPIAWRESIGALLFEISCGPDLYLDQDKRENHSDHLTDAINRTRGRAIEALVDFSWWVKNLAPEAASTPELHSMLKRRFSRQPQLSIPEYALLGAQFTRIFGLDPTWTAAHTQFFFPQDSIEYWRASFLAHIQYGRAYRDIFDSLRTHFEFGLRRWADLIPDKRTKNDALRRFGQHLLSYFLWFSPEAERLLRVYYDVTDPVAWHSLMDYLGRLLRESERVDAKIRDQCVRFFTWRMSAENPTELRGFNAWLEAPCFEPDWRLSRFLSVLKITKLQPGEFLTEIGVLRKLADKNLDLTMECFAELSDSFSQESYFYGKEEDVVAILRAAIESHREPTVSNALRTQENLLRAGHFEYLHIR